ncbi:MAG: HD domain-containing protein [Eubacteriales bacterium]|nr:HD domain-containing protein [Eubacteriales bacterium]
MKNVFVADLVVGTEITDFFLMKQATVRTGSNQKQFIDMILADRTGDVNAKKWDASPQEIAAIEKIDGSTVLKIRAGVNEWQGKKQLKITRFREAVPEDGIDFSTLIKTAPEAGEKMYAYIMAETDKIQDSDLKNVARAVMERNREQLLYYPAASKNHHAEMGGLLWHMKRMLLMGERACEVYTDLRPDWVITGVIIHDIEKIREIDSNRWGISPGYSFKGTMLGHITQGVIMIDRLAQEFGIAEEKAVMLEHMILTHHYEPEFGSPKRPMFPEAELLHYLDIFDARFYDMEEALSSTKPGDFSDKVWTLENRKVYKPTF